MKFIGGYLRGKAWNWFEPILRERETRNRREWSEGSYDEMKKAMNQVFGDVDERKTAARKLQQLRQTKSVTEYITEFQTITSNLDWDDDALEDKFLEGLKNHVKNALIFFPTNPKNLEELSKEPENRPRILEPEDYGTLHLWQGSSEKESMGTKESRTKQMGAKELWPKKH